jgi:hypothetical protein
MVSLSSILIPIQSSGSYEPSPFTIHVLATLRERCPLGIRIADLPVHHRMQTVKEKFTMEERYPCCPNRNPIYSGEIDGSLREQWLIFA